MLIAEQDKLFSGVSYDEALDQATTDMMEAFIGSGAASSTFDGGLRFDEAVIFSQEDLKPVLREAISSWLRFKTR